MLLLDRPRIQDKLDGLVMRQSKLEDERQGYEGAKVLLERYLQVMKQVRRWAVWAVNVDQRVLEEDAIKVQHKLESTRLEMGEYKGQNTELEAEEAILERHARLIETALG